MKKIFVLLLTAIFLLKFASIEAQLDIHQVNSLPVRGFCIAAPDPGQVDRFLGFIENELVPRQVNTLILRIDYRYAYQSHPELVSGNPLSKKELKKIHKACKKHEINLIPQLNLLGHQSWHSTPGKLIEIYPEFDETPHIELPEEYAWPNEDGLYCKSYCPLHPEVHEVVFDLVDELCEVLEADAFHAGMDEVFYIGDENCPRCSGKNKAELFAGEVKLIRDHLNKDGRELWIWGDRLLDGKTSGIGLWEASENDTHSAIDLIPKDVFICDWHYERPDPTPVYFSMKGYRVAACPYKKVDVGLGHMHNMLNYRKNSSAKMKQNFQGVIQTVWTSCERFLDEYYGGVANPKFSETACFKAIFPLP